MHECMVATTRTVSCTFLALVVSRIKKKTVTLDFNQPVVF